jgi:recombination protein RecT
MATVNGSGFVPVGSGSRQPDVPPVRAASTIVVREGAPFEVLMLRRSDASSFVPGAWVFPGGAVDAIDASFTEDEEEISILRACAHRELFEETGLWAGERPIGGRSAAYADLHRLSPPRYEAFLPVSRWITPRGVPKRFDTTFFVLHVEAGGAVEIDEREIVEHLWLDPREALDRSASGKMPMVLPTIRNLETLTLHASVSALLEAARSDEVPTFEPYLVEKNGKTRIVVPGEER